MLEIIAVIVAVLGLIPVGGYVVEKRIVGKLIRQLKTSMMRLREMFSRKRKDPASEISGKQIQEPAEIREVPATPRLRRPAWREMEERPAWLDRW